MDARHSKEAFSMKKQTLIKTLLAIAAGYFNDINIIYWLSNYFTDRRGVYAFSWRDCSGDSSCIRN